MVHEDSQVAYSSDVYLYVTGVVSFVTQSRPLMIILCQITSNTYSVYERCYQIDKLEQLQPIRECMWQFVKPALKEIVNVPVEKPFAKSRACEKKGFKVRTQYPPLSFLYKLAKEQGLIK
ncbi:unnamed protein product [Cylicostephanus goldi]|uniref:Uncharacterized protein n=1 Tax=Cylicostephanus goldi TaxID=71465 RepID=A0A3P7QM24_CYLGO|nr:unnamed protein product [Cylicostephanus goldi]